ncbi:NFX1-type zinc finger-containing protein 1 [Coniochaeta ligniaria NRRL 30616]|uniref:NFX1-type zinc finger-containing protein 1 n=1 Tax=Coniochaeta ligniaria NRRL 30616 TaxID=1408157 RepID=A0A1J7INC4_9PEZI|nr:NFX1-type zinc finger-containing protein 1 [Coniochaeta ligniaria NRRL 30616]
MADNDFARRSWRGRGGRERGGRLPSTISRQELRPCRYFQAHGTCRFGASCRFSHELDRGDGTAKRQSLGNANNPSLSEEDKFEYSQWKQLLWRRPTPRARDNITTLAGIWSGALQVLNGESRESQQLLIRDLVDDKNDYACAYVHMTLKIRLDDDACALSLVENFLRTITHAAILDSLSVDTYVGNLYNMISGAGGERAIAFFTDLLQSLLTESARTPTIISPTRLDGCLALILEALYQLLCREKRASFHDDLPKTFDMLDQLFAVLDGGGHVPERVCFSQRDRLDVLRRLVNLSNGLVQDLARDNENHALHRLTMPSAYPIQTELPGGRHDNDDMDITRISIIPTSAEITSDQPDYLPSTDCRQPHFYEDPVQRYFDTHFRLLRHDVFGPLKSAISSLIPAFQEGKPPSHLPGRDINAHLYQNASLAHISVHDKRGFEAHVDFSLPHHLRQKSADERRRWWDGSKRLEPGGLICLICSVEDNVVPLLLLVSEKCTDASRGQNTASKSHTGAIVVKLARLQLEDLQLLIRVYHKKCRGVLVALPGLIPATFTPILKNLQKSVGVGELPFHRYVVPRSNRGAGNMVGSSPPRYSLNPHFSFSLESIIKDKDKPLSVTSTSSPDDPLLLSSLERQTGLDAGQCRALVCALTREYALIQGPPGTGKSYLGVKLIQVLLDSKQNVDLGPIIIICYTNHALDQFLEHLLSVGIRKIIRIGGQNRSSKLEGHNLRSVSENTPRTRHEGYLLGKSYSDREEELTKAGKRLATLHQLRKGLPWAAMKRFLQRTHPSIYFQLVEDDVEGYQTVGNTDPLDRWLNLGNGRNTASSPRATTNPPAVDLLTARAGQNIDSLLPSERRFLADHWADIIQREETEHLFANIRESENLYECVNSVHSEVNRRSLLTADIIGVTTTALARDIATLQKLRAKVVVCEEAAEVLEAHMISALMPGVEHIIQIGDHQQLRPQINNYSLSLENPRGMLYQLDRSQFERLAVGEPGLSIIPVAQLNVQRRMRPEISSLIRSTMYRGLLDHTSVSVLPDVVGMRDNIFWLNHDNMEDTSGDDGRLKSHSNEWEVGMTKALVRHLVRQGEYKSTDIAVLTPYTGQLQKLRSAFSDDFEVCLSDRDEETLAREDFHFSIAEDAPLQARLQKKGLIESLRLATVDNFQGEEAKIVIVSLVRSNPQQKAGFLRTKNRINVLLSRAQHGLYLIGNADTYAGVPMWVEVHQQLVEAGAVGRAFNLCCPRHKDKPIECAESDHFLLLSPEGGCELPCDRRLEMCGHRCQAKCHSEAMHAVFFCPQPCPRVRLTCNHACPKLCGEGCGTCNVPIDQVELPCGHKKDRVRCCEAQKPSNIRCAVEVEKTVPTCGHVVPTPCFKDVSSEEFHCPTPCHQLLACGHVCPGTCGTCRVKSRDSVETHQTCRKICGKPSDTCNHICRRRCHIGELCPPCDRQCEMQCAHSRCSLKCSESCAPCIERCAWSCEHQGRCSMPCAAPCNRLPCDERCPRMLDCGHQCPGLCGEPCPEKYCQPCGSKQDQRVDLLEFKVYKDIDLDETPIVVLSCGHFFTAESLDGLARLGDVYSSDRTGKFAGLLEPSALLPISRCPDCQSPMRQSATQRYNRVVNAAVLAETSKRFLVKGRIELHALEKRIDVAETQLERISSEDKDDPQGIQQSWRLRRTMSDRYKELKLLEREVLKFCKAVSIEQMPSKKLADAILEARTRQPLDTRLSGLVLDEASKPTTDNRVILGGRLARIRIQATILADQFRLIPKKEADNDIKSPDKPAMMLLGDCKTFVEESSTNNLPRFAILGSLIYARIARCLQSSERCRVEAPDKVADYIATAKTFLNKADKMCDSQFEGAAELRKDVGSAQRLLGREWYEPVTKEERASIREAMISGSGGIATHSGHWYKCANGHTFAIGECGMPMEQARCPECGYGIGGNNHRMVAGVSRAMEMERE